MPGGARRGTDDAGNGPSGRTCANISRRAARIPPRRGVHSGAAPVHKFRTCRLWFIPAGLNNLTRRQHITAVHGTRACRLLPPPPLPSPPRAVPSRTQRACPPSPTPTWLCNVPALPRRSARRNFYLFIHSLHDYLHYRCYYRYLSVIGGINAISLVISYQY